MANRTDVMAQNVHGTDPQNLVERLLRMRIYNSRYWKEHCFGLNAETVVEKAVVLDHVGSTFGGNRKPTPFICLVLKLLQIQPPIEAVVEYVKQDEHKYLRALGAFYVRLVGQPAQVYSVLEPLLNDYRKLAVRSPSGWALSHIDELSDMLLRDEYAWELTMPKLPSRKLLVASGKLGPRTSMLSGALAAAAAAAEAAGGATPADGPRRAGDTADRRPREPPAGRGGEPSGRRSAPGGKDEDRTAVAALLARQRAAVEADASGAAGGGPSSSTPGGELSLDEWDRKRAALGMAPLRRGRR